MENNNNEYISVSSYAKLMGQSTQSVYNHIRDGKIEHINFTRGQYNGVLVKNPKA